MFNKIIKVISNVCNINDIDITRETKISDLGITSFEFVELCVELEEELSIEFEEEKLQTIITVGDLERYLLSREQEDHD